MNKNIQQKIAEILSEIHPKKDQNNQFDELIFDKVEDLVRTVGNEQIASKVYENSNKDFLKLSILFDILIWSTPDNGTELLRETKSWFFENDPNKLALVLHMTTVHPHLSFENLEKRLLEIQATFPFLKNRSDYWLENVRQSLESTTGTEKLKTEIEAPGQLIDIQEPVNCHLWTEELSKSLVLGAFEPVKNYTRDYHDSRDLKRCLTCGQLYFFEFREETFNGNDQVYYGYIPVKNEEDADKLNELSYFALTGFLSLRMNFPPDGSKPYWLNRKN